MDFRPRMTSCDLATTYFWKLTARASFWFFIYLISLKFKIWPIFRIFDLGWPPMTSWLLFSWKADVKTVILIYNLPTFNELRNLTLNDPKFVIWPQTQIFSDFTDHFELLLVKINRMFDFFQNKTNLNRKSSVKTGNYKNQSLLSVS